MESFKTCGRFDHKLMLRFEDSVESFIKLMFRSGLLAETFYAMIRCKALKNVKSNKNDDHKKSLQKSKFLRKDRVYCNSNILKSYTKTQIIASIR